MNSRMSTSSSTSRMRWLMVAVSGRASGVRPVCVRAVDNFAKIRIFSDFHPFFGKGLPKRAGWGCGLFPIAPLLQVLSISFGFRGK